MDEVRLIDANALCQHIQDWKTRCQERNRYSVGMYHMMIYEVLCPVRELRTQRGFYNIRPAHGTCLLLPLRMQNGGLL